jgi:ligand-binding SRPBCC domain-containing protein
VPQIFIYRSVMPATAHDVFAWHERPSALLELLPSSGFARVLSRSGGIRDGGRIVFTLGVGPLRIRWEAVHFGYVQDEQFCDEQVRGPFRVWRHTHRVTPLSSSSCRLEDRVEYALPGGRLIRVIAGPAVRRMLVSMFERRHAITRASFQPTTIDAKNARARRRR